MVKREIQNFVMFGHICPASVHGIPATLRGCCRFNTYVTQTIVDNRRDTKRIANVTDRFLYFALTYDIIKSEASSEINSAFLGYFNIMRCYNETKQTSKTYNFRRTAYPVCNLDGTYKNRRRSSDRS